MRFALALVLAVGAMLLPSVAAAQVRVVIDAGHGGTDPGGTGTGMQEKAVVLDVSTRFKLLLDADTADDAGGGKWTALMTRSTDVFVSLAGRSAYSNNNDADRFLSIHSNAFGDTTANGTETFSYAASGTSAQLRNLVQAEMITAWSLTNRGSKTGNYAVLRDTAAPAVLHELAFITNPTDAVKLGSDNERAKAAVAHLRAIQRHYSLAPYVPGSPTQPQDETGEIEGIVVDRSGPVVGATVALEGGATVVTDGNGAFLIVNAPAGARTLTASAAGRATKVVEVTVAAMARESITIELGLEGQRPDDPGDTIGGCTTTGHASPLLLLALAALLRRRRA